MLYVKAIIYALIHRWYDFLLWLETRWELFKLWAEETVIFHEQGADAVIEWRERKWREINEQSGVPSSESETPVERPVQV